MGQAKRRGTYEQRRGEAIERAAEKREAAIKFATMSGIGIGKQLVSVLMYSELVLAAAGVTTIRKVKRY